MDDLVPASHTVEAHLQLLRAIFLRARYYGLVWKYSKCMFLAPEVDFVGFTCSAEGFWPVAHNIASVARMSEPRSVRELATMVGFAAYYKHHMPDHSFIMANLQERLRGIKPGAKRKPVESWKLPERAAFAGMYEALLHPQMLHHYRPGYQLQLYTDASSFAVGAILTQTPPGVEGGPNERREFGPEETTIGFYSKVLSTALAKYSSVVKELLAVVLSLEAFEVHLRHHTVIIHTDCKALLFLNRNLSRNPVMGRLQVRLMEFSYVVRHLAGVSQPADALSRLISPDLLHHLRDVPSAGLPAAAKQFTAALVDVDQRATHPLPMVDICCGVGGAT